MSLAFRRPAFPVCNRAPVKFALPRLSYFSDGESADLYPHPHRLPITPPLDSPPLRLQDENLRCERNLGWSIDWAVAYLVKNLSKHADDVSNSLRRIRIKAQHVAQDGGFEDIVYRTFNQLDQTLFFGYLKDAVYLEIDSLGSSVSGLTFSHGRGPNPRVSRISIILNADLLGRAKPADVLATLIHHMIHAYLLVACGPEQEKEEGYGRLEHGVQFAKIMQTIRNLSTPQGRPLQVGFGHPLLPRGYYNGYYPPPPRQKMMRYCSHCYADVEPIPDRDIEEYYTLACKPLFELPDPMKKSTVLIYNKRDELEEVPRGEAPAAMDSVQFIFNEKETVLVPGDKVDAFFSIKRVFERKKSKYLEIHEEVSRQGFISLLQLLHTGTYGVDPSPVTGSGRRNAGPPIIKPVVAKSPAYLFTDAQLFNLGVKMGFDECKGIALERMNAQCITHEDPIAFLAEIYEGGDPDPDMRLWAKKFLAKTPLSSGSWNGASPPEPPNLIKLEQGMELRERFLELLEKSSALEIDVLKTKEYLTKNGLMGGAMSPARGLIPYQAPALGDLNVNIGQGMGMPMALAQRYPMSPMDRMAALGLDKYRALGMWPMAGMGMAMGRSMGPMGIGDRLEEWY